RHSVGRVPRLVGSAVGIKEPARSVARLVDAGSGFPQGSDWRELANPKGSPLGSNREGLEIASLRTLREGFAYAMTSVQPDMI
ncbi:hypothetical protein BV372_34115, partial [Nostoc sp. T09]